MDSSKLSEFGSETLEFDSNVRSADGRPMSSVATARILTRDIAAMLAPDQKWQEQVSAVFRALTSPHFEGRLQDLTWSRVKTWFFAEARRVDYDEMVALKQLKAREEAKREHRQFVAETNRLAAVLAREGASLSRRQMEILARIACRHTDVPRDHHPVSGACRRRVAMSRVGEAGR